MYKDTRNDISKDFVQDYHMCVHVHLHIYKRDTSKKMKTLNKLLKK